MPLSLILKSWASHFVILLKTVFLRIYVVTFLSLSFKVLKTGGTGTFAKNFGNHFFAFGLSSAVGFLLLLFLSYPKVTSVLRFYPYEDLVFSSFPKVTSEASSYPKVYPVLRSLDS